MEYSIKFKNTNENIRNCFIDLLFTHTLKNVNVSMICSMLKISRSTFYMHYLSLEELRCESISFYVNSFDQFLTDNNCRHIKEVLFSLVDYVKIQSNFYRIAYKIVNKTDIDNYYSVIFKHLPPFASKNKLEKYFVYYNIYGTVNSLIKLASAGFDLELIEYKKLIELLLEKQTA